VGHAALGHHDRADKDIWERAITTSEDFPGSSLPCSAKDQLHEQRFLDAALVLPARSCYRAPESDSGESRLGQARATRRIGIAQSHASAVDLVLNICYRLVLAH
jgi:hypothetical protein